MTLKLFWEVLREMDLAEEDVKVKRFIHNLTISRDRNTEFRSNRYNSTQKEESWNKSGQFEAFDKNSGLESTLVTSLFQYDCPKTMKGMCLNKCPS